MILPTQSQHSSQRVPRHIIHSLQHEQFPSDGRHWHNSCSTTTTTQEQPWSSMKSDSEPVDAHENYEAENAQVFVCDPSKTNIIHKYETLTWMRHLLTSLAHRALLQAKAREKLDRRRRNTDEDCITTRTEPTGPNWAQEWETETDAINKQLKHQRQKRLPTDNERRHERLVWK